MAATYARRSSIAPMSSHPLLASRDDNAHGNMKQYMMKRRASMSDAPTTTTTTENGTSATTPSHEARTSWWQNLTNMAKGRLRRRSSSSMSQSNGLHSEMQWFGSPIATATCNDNGQVVVFTSLCYNETGDLLAAGDKRGHVILLQRDDSASCGQLDYKVYQTFQSHSAEYDFQKTADINPEIVKIRWLKRASPSRFLLASNERSVRLWKLNEHSSEVTSSVADVNHNKFMTPQELSLPVVHLIDPPSVKATLRRKFNNGHEYVINSVSINSDQQTFMSADDLRINVWNVEIDSETYNVVDLKPPGATEMTELTEIITSAEFHPDDSHVFAYTTNDGEVRLCDMRQQALCDKNAKCFQYRNGQAPTFVSEATRSVSDIKFSRTDGSRYLLTRDYMTMKIWDIRCDGRGPCETIAVHPYLSGKLSSLYDKKLVEDRFECDWGHNDRILSSGSYHDIMHVVDRDLKTDVNLRISSALDSSSASCTSSSSSSSSPSQLGAPNTVQLKPCQVVAGNFQRKKKDDINVEKLNYSHKLQYIAWHPSECVMAVASGNRIYGVLGRDVFR